MAGLPNNVTDLLENDDVSFLRRSAQRYLGRIGDVDIEATFERTVEDAGKHISYEALDQCVKAIKGFPYMMQLVDYRTWEAAGHKPHHQGRPHTPGRWTRWHPGLLPRWWVGSSRAGYRPRQPPQSGYPNPSNALRMRRPDSDTGHDEAEG